MIVIRYCLLSRLNPLQHRGNIVGHHLRVKVLLEDSVVLCNERGKIMMNIFPTGYYLLQMCYYLLALQDIDEGIPGRVYDEPLDFFRSFM